MRIGIGHDTHRLIAGGPLRLGGIDIPFDHQLDGHSDADVLLHAVTDSILGAAALGDIGQLFPNTDADNADRDSAEMLEIAARSVVESGYRLANIDCIVFAERPPLMPHKAAIVARLAQILQMEPAAINVKAKTGEAVGPIGRGEAIAAECIALLLEA